jgi:hypothetical protein
MVGYEHDKKYSPGNHLITVTNTNHPSLHISLSFTPGKYKFIKEFTPY